MSAVNFEMKSAQRSNIRKNHVVVGTRKFILKMFSTLQRERERKIILFKNKEFILIFHTLRITVKEKQQCFWCMAQTKLSHISVYIHSTKFQNYCKFFLFVIIEFFLFVYFILNKLILPYHFRILLENSIFDIFCNFHDMWKHLFVTDFGLCILFCWLITYYWCDKYLHMFITWWYYNIFFWFMCIKKRVANKNTEPKSNIYLF